MSAKVLVVDDKQMMRDSVAATLQRAGYTPVAACDGPTALKQAQKHRPVAVVTDLQMPGMTGIELLSKLRQIDDQLPVVLMTAYGTIGEAVEAMKIGAFDFIQKPFEGDQLVLAVNRAVNHHELLKENAQLKATTRLVETPPLIGGSPAMRHVAAQIRQIAHSQGTVLIAGESGTGKEVVARTLHAFSQRRERAMLCLNCAALSSSLLESELFGHERGAFTGADQLRKGRFELADGGSLFLDEVSEIGPELQAKLLRVLQEGQFERVGSSITMQVDVRVIATTNRDLTRSVMAGEFRQDLYYRLNVLPIHLPPLRERVEDIALLAEHFLGIVASREGAEPKRLTEEAVAVLQRYAWPGNVRELQNICERAHVLAREPMIHGSLLQPWLITPMPVGPSQSAPQAPARGGYVPGAGVGAPPPQTPQLAPAPGSGAAAQAAPLAPDLDLGASPMQNDDQPTPPALTESANFTEVRTLEEVEREQILMTLDRFGGNRARTAEALGIGLRTLGLKLKKWKELQLIAETV